MSLRTAPQHTASELSFLGCDDTTGIVAFIARSRHDATRVNIVSLDTTTGAIFCDCRGADCNRRCWHADHIEAAWLATPAMRAVRWLTGAQLRRYGTKHRLCVDTYRTRANRARPDDMLALVAARHEWRKRATVAALPLAA